MRLVYVENNDSFSWNVVDLLPFPRTALRLVRGGTDEALRAVLEADAVVIGPGPTDPLRAGLVELVRRIAERGVPLLGVCLGHQAIGVAFGARLERTEPAHGQVASCWFEASRSFPGVEGRLEVMRYHSLSLDAVRAPLKVVARADGLVMAVEHETLPIAGLQFHPDSWATREGRRLVEAFFQAHTHRAHALTRSTRDDSSALRQVGESDHALTRTTRDDSPALRQVGQSDHAPTRTMRDERVPSPLGERARVRGSSSADSQQSKLAATAPRRALRLSQLAREQSESFALLGPGFTGEWTLLEPGGGDARLVLAGYDGPRREVSGRLATIDLELDVPAADLDVVLDERGFLDGVARIREAIAAGDVYQVNLTQRAQVRCRATSGSGARPSTTSLPAGTTPADPGRARLSRAPPSRAEGQEREPLGGEGYVAAHPRLGGRLSEQGLGPHGPRGVEEPRGSASPDPGASAASRAPLGGAQLLATLCRRGAPRFAAWVKLPGLELVSASPELLFELDGRTLRAEPMKGTAPPERRAWLEASAKDRAELAMITDLLRDDLQRLCEPRSVQVTNERRFIELPYALQTVSDVEGRLRDGVGLDEVLAQLHPGGSVTGAPRAAARAFIAQLEATPRGLYCGALGVVDGERARFALLIRSAARLDPATWEYGVGGGITWASNAAAELDEVRLKLGALGAGPNGSPR